MASPVLQKIVSKRERKTRFRVSKRERMIRFKTSKRERKTRFRTSKRERMIRIWPKKAFFSSKRLRTQRVSAAGLSDLDYFLNYPFTRANTQWSRELLIQVGEVNLVDQRKVRALESAVNREFRKGYIYEFKIFALSIAYEGKNLRYEVDSNHTFLVNDQFLGSLRREDFISFIHHAAYSGKLGEDIRKQFSYFQKSSVDFVEDHYMDRLDNVFIRIRRRYVGASNRRGGAFFAYWNNSHVDLKRYQIWKKEDMKDAKSRREFDYECLYYAISKQNHIKGSRRIRDEYKILRKGAGTSFFQVRDLKFIANSLKIRFELRTVHTDSERYREDVKFIGKDGPVYRVALFQGHYFVYENVKSMEILGGEEFDGSSLELVNLIYHAGLFGWMRAYEHPSSGAAEKHLEGSLISHLVNRNTFEKYIKNNEVGEAPVGIEHLYRPADVLRVFGTTDEELDSYSEFHDKTPLFKKCVSKKEGEELKTYMSLEQDVKAGIYVRKRGRISEVWLTGLDEEKKVVFDKKADAAGFQRSLSYLWYVLSNAAVKFGHCGRKSLYVKDPSNILKMFECWEGQRDFLFKVSGGILLRKNKVSVVGFGQNDLTFSIPIKRYEKIPPRIIFFDIETSVSTGNHLPYTICWKGLDQGDLDEFNVRCPTTPFEKEEYGYFFGPGCLEDFLVCMCERDCNTNTVFIAHNLSYDASMFLSIVEGTQVLKSSIIKSSKKMNKLNMMYSYTFKGESKHSTFVFLDSLAFFPESLDRFGQAMVQDKTCIHKETFPHGVDLFREDLNHVPISELGKFCDIDQLRESARVSNSLDGDFVDLNNHCVYYCAMDVAVLTESFIRYRDILYDLDHSGMDCTDFVSLPSFAHHLMRRFGVLDEVCTVKGPVRDFARQCSVGGKTMSRKNKVVDACSVLPEFDDGEEKINSPIVDLDVSALYVSTMAKCQCFPKGQPSIVEDQAHLEKLLRNNYPVLAKVEGVSINREWAFPILSLVKNGVRCFTNEVVGEVFYLDSFTLCDAIKMQGFKFSFIEGIYWAEGFVDNRPWGTFCLDTREKYKQLMKQAGAAGDKAMAAGYNAMQYTMKLLGNASYGKLGQRPIQREEFYCEGEDELNARLRNNFHRVTRVVEHWKGFYQISTVKACNNQTGYHQCSAFLLGASKRIMNRICASAEAIGAKLLYMDTDSIHTFGRYVEPLQQEFHRRKYHLDLKIRQLIGNEPGALTSDFESKKLSDAYPGCEIVSKKLIVCGKKCYIDVLCRKEDLYNDSCVVDYHARMKGMPKSVLPKFCAAKGMSLLKFYEQMLEGKKHEVNLAEFSTTCFQSKGFQYSTMSTMNRSFRVTAQA